MVSILTYLIPGASTHSLAVLSRSKLFLLIGCEAVVMTMRRWRYWEWGVA